MVDFLMPPFERAARALVEAYPCLPHEERAADDPAMLDVVLKRAYEVIPDMLDECGQVTLAASYTPNNGIRLGLLEPSEHPDWMEFDFTPEQALVIGEALIRWAKDDAA